MVGFLVGAGFRGVFASARRRSWNLNCRGWRMGIGLRLLYPGSSRVARTDCPLTRRPSFHSYRRCRLDRIWSFDRPAVGPLTLVPYPLPAVPRLFVALN